MCRISKLRVLLSTFLRSLSANSSTMQSVLKLSGSSGGNISISSTTHGCLRDRNSVISLKILLQSVSSSNILSIFLIATLFPVDNYVACATDPQLPYPSIFSHLQPLPTSQSLNWSFFELSARLISRFLLFYPPLPFY